MSVLLRARIASFMTGVAVTSVFAIYQLKKDLDESQEIVVKQVLYWVFLLKGSKLAYCTRLISMSIDV